MTNLFLSNRAYDTLKWIAQIFLPALGGLYFSLANLWALPEPDKVVGTITVIDAFLGLLLAKSSSNYNKSDEKFDGSLTVKESAKEQTVSIEVKDEKEDLGEKEEVLLKVETEVEPVEVTVKPKPRKRTTNKKV